MPQIMKRLTEATGIANMVGACGYSIAAGDKEYCDEPVVACLVGTVPDGSAKVFTRPTERPQGWLGVVHADPQVPALPELIEDFAEALRLKALGCGMGQGYFYGRPVDAEATLDYIARKYIDENASSAESYRSGAPHYGRAGG